MSEGDSPEPGGKRAGALPGPEGFSRDELVRYARHLIMPEVGPAGQARLKAARVLCVGAGGLGSPLALYLAAAGVGRLGLVDFDTVDLTNIQRQILYATSDVGRPKTEAARERLLALNETIEVVAHPERLSAENASAIIAEYEIVADGTDNFETRYLVNDACVLAGKPNVHGSIFRFEGQIAVFDARRGPCYRCLFPAPPPPGAVPSCAEAGVLGVLPGIVGSLQALEVLKLILGIGEPLVSRLVLIDALSFRFQEIALPKDPACPVCGPEATIRAPGAEGAACATPIAEGAADRAGLAEMTVEGLREALDAGERLEVLDVREPFEHEIAHLDGDRLIPLGELSSRIASLDPGADYVVYCHIGIRSAYAVSLLRASGFTRVRNLIGGIEAWASRIDPSMPRY